MSLFMETTKIDPARTVAEITRVLSNYEATAILTEFQGKEVSGLFFKIKAGENEINFRLPCRWEAIFKILQRHRKINAVRYEDEDRAKAKRVAWRQILRWTEAQLALVDTGMVKVEEVFMPYIQVGINETLFNRLESAGLPKLLGEGKAR